MKIVINVQYGGFSLSPLAVKRIAELQGKECYFFTSVFSPIGNEKEYTPLTVEEATEAFMWSAYSVPNPQDYRLSERDEDGLYKSANARAEQISLKDRDIERNDPLLVQVVEELGEKANGSHATLKIVEIPDGTDFTIEEYDGNEHIAESHQTWS